MSGPFVHMRYHAYAGETAQRDPDAPVLRGVAPSQPISDEAVARKYLSESCGAMTGPLCAEC